MQLYLKAQSAIIINHIKMLDSEQSHVLINSFKSDYKTPNSNVDFKIISFNNMKKNEICQYIWKIININSKKVSNVELFVLLIRICSSENRVYLSSKS